MSEFPELRITKINGVSVSDSAEEMASKNKWSAPMHEHTVSVYIQCKDCLMFSIPLPGKYQCGNCQSKDTVSYNPPCCVAAALREYRTAVLEEAERIAENYECKIVHGDEICTCYIEIADEIRRLRRD